MSEALAARLRVAIADISWRRRIMLEGARAVEFLSKLVTRDAAKLSPGTSLKALWLSDGGGCAAQA
jgi:glycine cleavage system aminomethyltransferase T